MRVLMRWCRFIRKHERQLYRAMLIALSLALLESAATGSRICATLFAVWLAVMAVSAVVGEVLECFATEDDGGNDENIGCL